MAITSTEMPKDSARCSNVPRAHIWGGGGGGGGEGEGRTRRWEEDEEEKERCWDWRSLLLLLLLLRRGFWWRLGRRFSGRRWQSQLLLAPVQVVRVHLDT